MAVGGTNGAGRLDSWKAIADYLGRDVGTVRRWERTRGLPVHRVPGGKGSSVFAYAPEIEAWLRSAPQETPAQELSPEEPPTPEQLVPAPPKTRARWRWAAGAAALAGALLLGWVVQQPAASAEDIHLTMTEQALTALDANDRELWVHRFDPQFRHPLSAVGERSRIVLRHRPAIYFTTSHRYRRDDNAADSGEFTSLDLDGRPRWSFRFNDELTIGGKPYRAPWAVTAFSVDDSTGVRRLAVAAHHYVWGPSVLALLDDDGRRTGTFVNDGWIEQVQWLSPSRLAIGGFSESRDGAMVALIDPSRPDGQAPEPSDSPHYCQSCGTSAPVRMAVLPRSEVNLVTHSRFNRAILERTTERLIVRTVEVPDQGQGAADAIYEFTPGLEFVGASYSRRYWEIHDELTAARRIDHDRAHCPDRDGPREIQLWTPDGGWRVISRQPRVP